MSAMSASGEGEVLEPGACVLEADPENAEQSPNAKGGFAVVRRADLSSFRFIDLCAGIGGFRWALERAGGRCVLSLERDRAAQKTYRLLHGEWPVWSVEAAPGSPWRAAADATLEPGCRKLPPAGAGDITRFHGEYGAHVPEHDVLAAGFPCQPFSLAGVSKKNALGMPHGFDDEDQGQLFFRILEIARARRPKVLFLENVKNLRSHDAGRTWAVILEHLLEDHHVAWQVIDACYWVPQHRERTIIVAVRRDSGIASEFVDRFVQGGLNRLAGGRRPTGRTFRRSYRTLRAILERSPAPAYVVGPGTWDTLERHRRHHAEAGNGFGYGLVRTRQLDDEEFCARTLSARYHKDGAEVLIERPSADDGRPRRLTPYECAGLMGLPRSLRCRFHPAAPAGQNIRTRVADVNLYRQFGNSVVFPVVGAVAEIVAGLLRSWQAGASSMRKRASNAAAERELPALP